MVLFLFYLLNQLILFVLLLALFIKLVFDVSMGETGVRGIVERIECSAFCDLFEKLENARSLEI